MSPAISADVTDLKRRACAKVDAIAATLVEVSHAIHDAPELNYREYRAAQLLGRTASEFGLPVELGACGLETAFIGQVGSGPVVGFICEYDALPGIGHGCGHNVIAAAGLGAAIAAAEVSREAGGAVRLIGTPAEEGGGGKVLMDRAGAFDGLAAAMMVHPADVEVTQIDAICVQQLTITYAGVESHAAAAPHLGRNALDAAVIGYMAVAALRQHIRPCERIHGIFTEAGEKANVVPRRARTSWYVRSDTMGNLRELRERVLAALQSGAAATGCSCTHEWDDRPYDTLVSNDALEAAYVLNAASIGRRVVPPSDADGRVVGSTDMGNVSHVAPSIHPMIAIAPPGTPIHTERFAVCARSADADRAVIDGAKALAMTAIDLWVQPGLAGQVQARFEALARPL